MNITAPSLSPLFRSDAQGEILARVFLNNGSNRYTTAELARVTHTSYATTHREVQRLIDADLVDEEFVGRSKVLSANEENPAFRHLVALLELSYGPSVVIPRELSDVSGIEGAYIYGSWADRRAGSAGSSPGDIDVLVVGNPSRASIAEAAGRAEKGLSRDVNIRIVSAESWRRADDLFIKTVKQRPLYSLELTTAPR